MAVELYLTRTMERFLRLLEKDAKKVENGRLKDLKGEVGNLRLLQGVKELCVPVIELNIIIVRSFLIDVLLKILNVFCRLIDPGK